MTWTMTSVFTEGQNAHLLHTGLQIFINGDPHLIRLDDFEDPPKNIFCMFSNKLVFIMRKTPVNKITRLDPLGRQDTLLSPRMECKNFGNSTITS